MEAFAITNKGTEKTAAEEILEIIKLKSEAKTEERLVKFQAKNYEDICKIIYLGQSFSKVCVFLGEFTFEDGNDFEKKFSENISKSKLEDWLHDELSFRTECTRESEHNFSSIDIEKEAGGVILAASKAKLSVDLKNPQLKIFIFINNSNCIYGIDLSGIDLSSREYKIFTHRQSFNGTIAFSLVKLSGWDRKKLIIDPMCGSGMVPIEAAIWQTGFSHNYYRKDKLAFTKMDLGFDQKKFFLDIDAKAEFPSKPSISTSDMVLASVNATQKNSKIAGVQKAISVSRIDMDWMDTKVEQNSISFIITQFPDMTRMADAKVMEKLYHEFFYQADYTLKKKNAVIVVVCNMPEKIEEKAKEFGFKLEGKYDFWQGKEKMDVRKFIR